ncbi:MAG: hypothetical protein COV52_06150 [Gammaproteobacteria bacterium CG11_big_fil_rev_8_21_14_0_20_46_22]|nr:MAG: hypothetical protein COW05_07510 [Gammaproteobacteria bacterium CG12_big_fil_rev_8_21_14_0_65_46_12]PIR11084.1 MAG: hypothetical protein COV52_06150 [Gammaproteobacteria bacterium CG11_big_fil_rev_8_21_14_0_20_46_22]
MSPRFFYTALLALAVIFWGGAFVGIRVAVLNGFDPGALALARYGLAALIMLPFLRRRLKPVAPVSLRAWPLIILTALCGVGIYGVCLNRGETHVGAGIASFIISQESVVMVVLGFFLLQEKTSPLSIVGIIIGLVGVALICFSQRHQAHGLVGIAWVFAGAVFASFYNVMIKRVVPRVGAMQFTFYALLASTVFLAVFYVPDLLRTVQHVNAKGWVAMLYLAIFPGIVSYSLMSIAGPKLPVSHIGAMLFLNPVIATLLGWWVLGEVPNTQALAGGVLALFSAVWIQFVAL